MNWRDQLVLRLQETRAASVCVLDAAARDLAGSALPSTSLRACAPPPEGRCALALGVDVLNGMPAREAELLIFRLRTYVAPRVLLVAQRGCALDEAAFRALGFTLALNDTTAQVRIHDYDIGTYKTVPDWLNARFWAHPERWEP